MIVMHVGLVCSSEENADKFYGRLLGLTKAETKELPVDITGYFFKLHEPMTVLHYTGQGAHLEVFICAREEAAAHPVGHVCLGVGDLDGFLARSRELGVEILQMQKGEKTITFVKDFDGNLFEIKP